MKSSCLLLTVLLLASPCTASPFTLVDDTQADCNVMRYDSSSSVSMENMSQVPACDNTPAPSRQQLRSNLLMPNANPFVIDFTCAAGVELRLCESAQAGFISAANRISQVIAFPQTVRVKATFRSFCNGTANRENCELADTLGQASPAAYFSARPEKEREAWYFYPVCPLFSA